MISCNSRPVRLPLMRIIVPVGVRNSMLTSTVLRSEVFSLALLDHDGLIGSGRKEAPDVKELPCVVAFLFRCIFAFCVIELPGGYPKLFKPLFLAHIILIAVGNHLSDVFLCHHRCFLLVQRQDRTGCFNRRLLYVTYQSVTYEC